MQLALRAPATMISQMTLRDPTQHFVYVEERENRETQELSLIPTPSLDEFRGQSWGPPRPRPRPRPFLSLSILLLAS